MFFLRLNIPYCVVNSRDGDAEGSIPFLPLKETLVSKGLMNPLCGVSLEKLHRLCNWKPRSQTLADLQNI